MDLLYSTVLIHTIGRFHVLPLVEIIKNVIFSHSTTSLTGLSFKNKECHLFKERMCEGLG